MRFRRGATLDTGQVTDARGRGAPLALGGGGLGILGLLIYLAITLLSGGGGLGPAGPSTTRASEGDTPSTISQDCQTGEDANQRDDCRIVGVVNSVQKFWNGVFTASNRSTSTSTRSSSPTRSRPAAATRPRRRTVLLPGRPPRLHRPRVLRRRQVAARRRGDAVRPGLCARARVRPPRPGPARRPRRDPRRNAGAGEQGRPLRAPGRLLRRGLGEARSRDRA